jgi:hypothetical protein
MENKVYKTSFNLSADDFKLLETLANNKGVTKADIVRQALSNYKFINDTIKEGGNVLVEDKSHRISKVIFR